MPHQTSRKASSPVPITDDILPDALADNAISEPADVALEDLFHDGDEDDEFSRSVILGTIDAYS